MMTPVHKNAKPDDSVKSDGTVVYIPFWLVALVSFFLLLSGYAIYRFLTAGDLF